jgi:hypothetical protein
VSPFWLSDAPLLLFPALALFLVGLAASIRRWRDVRYAALVCAVVLTTVFGGAIWTAAPLYVRYMTAAPAIALLVGVAVKHLTPLSPLHATERGGKHLLRSGLVLLLILVVCVEGIVVSLWQHPAEARARITAGQWWVDEAAREAAALPENASVVLVVQPEFGEVERITLADYLAAYGLRRAVAVNSGQAQLVQRQMDRLPKPVITLEPEISD